IGYNEIDLSWLEFLLNKKLNMLTIHGRTKREMSKVPAHWDVVGKARELRDKLSPTTLIVGNGDVESREHGMELINQYKLDGIMIGRGIFHDPFALAEESPWGAIGREQRIELYKSHVQLFAQTWQNNERPIHTLNKFCKIYINGFDGAKELRERLMASQSAGELLDTLSAALSVSMQT
ncbi:MAG: tRNA-dihydrouridine synthase, partial [Candidatus Saccharimonadales bacterium]